MKLIALTVLVAFVSCRLLCTRSEYEEHRFKEIPEKEFQSLIKRSERKINDTDCTQSYKVQLKNSKIPFYVFVIERQNFTRIYGIINEDEKQKHRWHESDKDEFIYFLNSCTNTDTTPTEALENFKEKQTALDSNGQHEV
ncbi:hypothetical protein GCK32_004448 [Trichostrongylus colubriformis]|uniref:Uncharacterized protein n=1 Tax=Trichostrongylus colubriformis TaxID=6319 RepID=A0AAN8J1R4_TRICO